MTELHDIFGMLGPFLKSVFAFDPESPLLFTQFYFWAFFALVFALFSLLHNRLILRNLFLFVSSVFFYYKTSGLCVFILLFCVMSDFLLAKRIHRSVKEGARRFWLIVSLSINLLLLCYFKYSYFFADLLHQMTGIESRVFNVFAWTANQTVHGPVFSVDRIVLPVGISFYLFQTISYTVDVYRRRIEPVDNVLDYGFFVSFFPQLVAGPIVRASVFLPQMYQKFSLSRRQFGLAVFWILNGLVKKLVLSDFLAVNYIDRIFDSPVMYTGFENLMALFLYSLQVYADFSGYTDIATGVARLMGFRLPQNFNSPYKATNPGNFWKRWHISLSKWLQDYLYIPLGGNRKATFGTYFWLIAMAGVAVALSHSWVLAAVLGIILALALLLTRRKADSRRRVTTDMNSLTTMLLGGLWHGASLNFVIWGGLNGVGTIVYKIWKRQTMGQRALVITSLFAVVYVLGTYVCPGPLLNIGRIWLGVMALGTLVRFVWGQVETLWPARKPCFFTSADGLGKVWGITQTFVFITFTRLFFRSGSNLNPAEANRQAWETATQMIGQIGGQWNTSLIPPAIVQNWEVFALFVFGMLVHWLPDRFKRRYRARFATLPLPLMALAVVAVVFVVRQFITSDLKAFIYFQF